MARRTPAVEVSMTDRAVEKVCALLAERGVERPMLRVFVAGGGCSGYQYGMAPAEKRQKGDLLIDRGRLTLIVDSESAPLISGAEIDFIEDLMGSGFTIHNPNATSTCACGQSFGSPGCNPSAGCP